MYHLYTIHIYIYCQLDYYMLPLPTIYKGNQHFQRVLRSKLFFDFFEACVDFMDRDAPLRPLVEMRRKSHGEKRVVPVEGETTQRGEGGIESLHM